MLMILGIIIGLSWVGYFVFDAKKRSSLKRAVFFGVLIGAAALNIYLMLFGLCLDDKNRAIRNGEKPTIDQPHRVLCILMMGILLTIMFVGIATLTFRMFNNDAEFKRNSQYTGIEPRFAIGKNYFFKFGLTSACITGAVSLGIAIPLKIYADVRLYLLVLAGLQACAAALFAGGFYGAEKTLKEFDQKLQEYYNRSESTI
jgi:hypothetical protein